MQIYGIESYVAVPLFRRSGDYFGTLCTLDRESKDLNEETLEIFELFADLIAYELEFEEQAKIREEALKLSEQSNESKARFMSILGHDLRSPLNTIAMAARLQQNENLPVEKNVELAATVSKTAQRMKYLIEDLLDTTQSLQGNGIRIEKHETDLSGICLQIIKEFKIANRDQQIDFQTEGIFAGEWDEGRIGQVLSNLLSNAIQYGDREKPVKISLTKNRDEGILLSVNNQGSVIAPEAEKNLFLPFWRGARKKHDSSGLGLGLYIVKQIVEAHGGTISAASNENDGTTFTVRF